MNRREVMAAMAGMCGAAGVDARMDAVSGDRPVTLAIIHCEKPMPRNGLEAIHAAWERLRKIHKDLPPCVVMEKGLRLELK